MLKTFSPSNGHSLDIDPAELADNFLSLAQNVHTRKRFPSRINGRRQAYTTAAAGALHLLGLRLNSFDWWMQFNGATVKASETTNNFDITPAVITAITNPFEWSTALLNGIPVACNGKNNPYTWNGSGASIMVPLTGWPAPTTIPHAVATFRFHIFAMNIDSAGGTSDNLVMWSDAAATNTLPGTWVAAAGNEAGSTLIADTPGRCICGLPLAQQLAIYKPQSIYAVEYVGQPRIFSQRAVIRSIGALGPKCVQEISGTSGTRHLVMGNDDIVIYDGMQAVSIAADRIKLYLANSIDGANSQNSFIVRDPNKRETWFCVPETGNQFANIAHVYDESRNTWVTRDLNSVRHAAVSVVSDLSAATNWDADAATWDSDNTIWNDQPLNSKVRILSSEGGGYFLEDTSDLVVLQSRIARYDISFDDDTQRKVTSRILVRGTGAGIANLQVRLGARESPDDAIQWGAFTPLVPGEGVPYEVEGRYISFEISHLGSDPYTINRIVIDARYTGKY